MTKQPSNPQRLAQGEIFSPPPLEPSPDTRARWARQREAIERVMLQGKWLSIEEIAGRAKVSRAVAMARLRELGMRQHGGYAIGVRASLSDPSSAAQYRVRR